MFIHVPALQALLIRMHAYDQFMISDFRDEVDAQLAVCGDVPVAVVAE